MGKIFTRLGIKIRCICNEGKVDQKFIQKQILLMSKKCMCHGRLGVERKEKAERETRELVHRGREASEMLHHLLNMTWII